MMSSTGQLLTWTKPISNLEVKVTTVVSFLLLDSDVSICKLEIHSKNLKKT